MSQKDDKPQGAELQHRIACAKVVHFPGELQFIQLEHAKNLMYFMLPSNFL